MLNSTASPRKRRLRGLVKPIDRIVWTDPPHKAYFHVPLEDDDIRLLGEICAVIGQIEFLMQLSVADLLDISQSLAQRILGSTSLAINTEIWAETVKAKCKRRDLHGLAEAVRAEIGDIMASRNDFFHTIYGIDLGEENFALTRNPDDAIGRTPIAIRVKTMKKTPITELKVTRDKAAQLSHFVAHIRNAGTAEWVKTDPPSVGLGQPLS